MALVRLYNRQQVIHNRHDYVRRKMHNQVIHIQHKRLFGTRWLQRHASTSNRSGVTQAELEEMMTETK